jgi:putative peptidoglycan lipid II flippase
VTVGRLARAAAIVAVFGLLSRLLGFAREIVLAAAYGTTGVTDAFVNSLLIVNTVAAVLLYTLVTLIIPVFQRERAESGADSAWRLVAALAVWTGLGLVVLASLAALFPEALAALFRLDPARAEHTAQLIRIMSPAIALQGFSAIFTAMLQIHGRFAGPAAVGVAFNLGIIVAVLVGQDRIGIEAAAWGVTIGATLQVLLQLPQFWRLLREARPRAVLTHPRLAGVGLLALPVLGASVLQQVNNFTDKLFASSLEAGRVAALSFANALGQAPRAALLLPLLTPLFPLIARLMSERREDEALTAFRRVAGLLGLVAFPMSLLLAIWADEVAQLAFQREACGEECVAQIAPPLVWYALGLWPAFLSLLLNRTLSAANLQRDILWTTIVTVVLTIVLDIILLGPMEQAGLALAATLGVFANAAMLLARMRRRFPSLRLRALAARQARLLAAAGAGAAAALLLDLALPTTDLPSLELAPVLAAKAVVAIAVAGLAARALAAPELAEGWGAVRSLTGRRGARGGAE